MTKILYIFPPNVVGADEKVVPPQIPPLGIAYLSAYLQKHAQGEFEERVVDCMLEADDRVRPADGFGIHGILAEDVIDLLGGYTPDIIAISAITSKVLFVLSEYLQKFKQVYPKAFIVLGGNHASIEKGGLLRNYSDLDLCVTGEGEITFLELCSCIGKSKSFGNCADSFSDIKGLVFRKDGKVVENEERPLIENLDEIPFPNWSLFDLNRYFANAKQYHSQSYNMRQPSLPVVTSRGCPYKCAFCAFPLIWGKQAKWRARSPENIVAELKELVLRFSVREIQFMDDNINVHKPRFVELCAKIIDSKLNLKWAAVSGISIKGLDREALTLMKKSGAYRFVVGFETGSDNTTTYIKKKYDREEGVTAIREAKSLGFWTGGNFMLGFPYETVDDMAATAGLVMQSGVDFLVLNIAAPYPGTKMREDFVKEGLVVDSVGADQFYGGWDLVYLRKREVQEFSDKIQRTFFASKVSLRTVVDVVRKIRSPEDFFYMLKVMKKMFAIIFAGILAGRISYVAGYKRGAEKFRGPTKTD